jgi:hypothetical protein
LILALLVTDEDAEIRAAATATLNRLAVPVVASPGADSADDVRNHAHERAVAPAAPVDITRVEVDVTGLESLGAVPDESGSLFSDDSVLTAEEGVDRETVQQKITQMGIPDRVKAAVKGSREVRALLIRDPNRIIASAVLTSPKLTESEVESFARMGNVSEDVLRIIGSNRSWMKNYGVMAALIKNAKTPLALSLNLMHRLNDRDLLKLSLDRNVMEPLRVAAKRKVANAKV